MAKEIMKLFYLILPILFLILQNTSSAKDSDSTKYYSLNAHIGADYAKGLRFGMLVYLQEYFSIEASFGRDAVNYFYPSDPNNRFSIGINWHKGINSNLIVGIAFSHSIFPSPIITKQNFMSANIGSFIINESGIRFFYKGGILFRLKKNNSGNHNLILPNIDIGLSYNIF